MRKFVLLHYGFTTPTPEIMAKWNQWFDSYKEQIIDNSGFASGSEISSSGSKELPLGPESVTGSTTIHADSREEALRIASQVPFIASVQIYEVRSHG